MFVSRENSGHAPVAQLDRASAYEAEGREFEPLRARHSNPCPTLDLSCCFLFNGYNSL